ncbi:hypothetical protein CKY10_16055 [Photorhabdus sp. HUG-39]|nr:hypothetical protein CKY10_16055 [Photorhabdus sp. HUG-39]
MLAPWEKRLVLMMNLLINNTSKLILSDELLLSVKMILPEPNVMINADILHNKLWLWQFQYLRLFLGHHYSAFTM